MTKAGFAGDDAPRCVFPAMVGRPKHATAMMGSEAKDCFIGDEAQAKRGILKLSYPVEHGQIKDWDDVTKIWNHCFQNELRVNPSDHNVMLTEAPKNGKANREKMCRIFFEEFGCKGFYVQIQAVLALYSSGRTTGLVVDAGDGVTHSVPVYEGYSLPHAINRLDLAGRDLTTWMGECLKDEGTALVTSAELEIVRNIKEELAFIAIDYAEAVGKAEKSAEFIKEYELPDGRRINVNIARFKCGELLFQPSLNGKEYAGIHLQAYDSIQKCDIDIRSELYQNVILSGGTTMFKGLPERLEKELQALLPAGKKAKVNAAEDRKYAVFVGGSILAALPTFESMWITAAEFGEHGPGIANRKCM